VTEDSTSDSRGIIDIAKYLYKDIKGKNLSSVAKQIAYDVLFAIAPLLIFITALAGYITQRVYADRQNPVVPVMNWVEDNLPADAASVLRDPVENALNTDPGYLLSFGAILALWGGKNAAASVMTGLNLCYGKDDSRSWIVRQLIAIGLTVAVALALGLTSVVLVLGSQLGDRVFEELGMENALSDAMTILQWPVAIILLVLAVTLLHWAGPDVDASFRWFLPGAVVSVVLWGLAILGLQIYFTYAGGFGEAYGVFGAMLVFIYWLWVMGLVTLIGGSFNHALHNVPVDAEQRSARESSEIASAST